MLTNDTTTAATSTTRSSRRHARAAWPHKPHASAVCRACCVEMAEEFAADERRLIVEMIEREPESDHVPSEALPF